jgi:hypothetical protein
MKGTQLHCVVSEGVVYEVKERFKGDILYLVECSYNVLA